MNKQIPQCSGCLDREQGYEMLRREMVLLLDSVLRGIIDISVAQGFADIDVLKKMHASTARATKFVKNGAYNV